MACKLKLIEEIDDELEIEYQTYHFNNHIYLVEQPMDDVFNTAIRDDGALALIKVQGGKITKIKYQ